MMRFGAIHYHTSRALYIGVGLLALHLLLAVAVYCFVWDARYVTAVTAPTHSEIKPLTISLGLREQINLMPVSHVGKELSFSLDPPRPNGKVEGTRVLMRFHKEVRSLELPCRVDLDPQREGPSSFWMELSLNAEGAVEGKWFARFGEKIDSGTFTQEVGEAPMRALHELTSPIKELAEAKLLGRDLLVGTGGERLELMSNETLEIREGDWLSFQDKWHKVDTPHGTLPIARMMKGGGFEAWDDHGYVRFFVGNAAHPWKVKPEELIGNLRVRSEKQISCTLEKQCLILKTGDYAVKMNGKWKVLRKKEDRDALFHGKLLGELFIFDTIVQTQGQKVVKGRLYNQGRTQVIPVELTAQSTKARKKP